MFFSHIFPLSLSTTHKELPEPKFLASSAPTGCMRGKRKRERNSASMNSSTIVNITVGIWPM